MPQADQDLVDKLQAIVQANFSGGPEPWNTVTAGHGEIREYCEALLEHDGFVIDGGAGLVSQINTLILAYQKR